MQIRSLKIYCDVVDRRSFSRAADDNGISQSSASQVVHQLEARLGVQLLDRSTRPFVITPEGQRYYDGCRHILRRYEQLEQEVRALHDAEACSLVVASIYSVGLHHMSAFMHRFSEDHPRAEARLEYLHPHRVCEAVVNGDADLGIVSYPEQTDLLEAIAWRSEPLALVCHPKHRLAAVDHVSFGLTTTPSISLSDLDDEPFVAFEQGLAIRDQIDRALAKQGVKVHVELEFDNVETIKRAIEINEGVGILPEPSVRRETAMGTLATATIEGDSLLRPLGIVHRRDRSLSPLARSFIELLKVDGEFVGETVGAEATTSGR
ncbi:MAG: LysR family transcriptional regulator [Planctomycetota bacterium]